MAGCAGYICRGVRSNLLLSPSELNGRRLTLIGLPSFFYFVL